MTSKQVPTPPPEAEAARAVCGFRRVSPAQAAADAIPLLVEDDADGYPYHLFHLTTPPWTRHHPPRLRSSWWRLRSRDLVNWVRDAQPCITPGTDAAAPDADGAWTGAAVVGPDGAMHIVYTGYNLGERGGQQVLLRARARDGTAAARTGFVLPGTPIRFTGGGRDQLEDVDFRDPFIFFHAAEARYWMVVATRRAQGPFWTRGCIVLLTSADLDTWAFHPTPLHSPGDMFCPECPELFCLPSTGKWYLVYSRFQAPNAGTVYRIADSPYGPFRIPRDGSHGRLDGRRWYAAKSCAVAGDPDRRVYFGWIGDRVDDEGKWLWGGDLAVPRIVSAAADGDAAGHLRVAPEPTAMLLARATSTAVPATIVPERVVLSSDPAGTTAVVAVGGDESGGYGSGDAAAMLSIAFSVDSCDAHAFGLILQPDAEQRGHRLQFTPSPGGQTGDASSAGASYTVALLTDLAPLDDFWADQYKFRLPRLVDGPEVVRHDNVQLDDDGVRLFLRGPLVEAFFGGRAISFRLPDAVPDAVTAATATHGLAANAAPSAAGATAAARPWFSWFVEDGSVALGQVSVRRGGRLDKVV